MNKYQKSLNCLGNIVLDSSSDGYYEPKTVQDFYFVDCQILQKLLDTQLTSEEIEVILVCMSYYNFRNQGELLNGIDVGYGGDLYFKLLKLDNMNNDE